MYAIFRSGGHQYRVREGDTIDVERLEATPGDNLTIDDVLLVGGAKKGVVVGRPTVDGASIRATVVAEVKGEKITVFKYKRKNRYRVKSGHRQKYTRLHIEKIKA